MAGLIFLDRAVVSLIHEAAAIVFLVRHRRKVRVSYRIEESARGTRATFPRQWHPRRVHLQERCRNQVWLGLPPTRVIEAWMTPLTPQPREPLAKLPKLSRPSRSSSSIRPEKLKFPPPLFSDAAFIFIFCKDNSSGKVS